MTLRALIISIGIFFISASGLADVGPSTKLSRAEVIELLKGNTAEGQLVGWGTDYRSYFSANGEFRQKDGYGHKKSGRWHVDANGELCIETTRVKCQSIRRRKKGGYDLYSRQNNKIVQTIERVSEGNPNNL